jgi:hypothetical protein
MLEFDQPAHDDDDFTADQSAAARRAQNDGTSPADLGFSPDMVEGAAPVLGGSPAMSEESGQPRAQTPTDPAEEELDDRQDEGEAEQFASQPFDRSDRLAAAFGWLCG